MLSLKQNTILDKWSSFYILYVILSSYSVYMVIFPIATIVQLGTIFVSFITLFLGRDKINLNAFILPLTISFIFIFSTFFSTKDTIATILASIRFISIFWGVIILYQQKIDLLSKIYQCLFCLMIFYFFCYILFDFLAPNLGLSYIYRRKASINNIYTYIYENHFNFYIRWVNSNSIFGIQIKRFNGFASEPGMYQIYLNYILMYLLFFAHTRQIKRIIFTIVNIVLCGSTMGVLLAAFFVLFAMMLQKNKYIRLLCFFPLIILGGVFAFYVIIEKSIAGAYSFGKRTSELVLIRDILFKNNILGMENISGNGSNGFIRFLWSYGYIAIISFFCLYVCIWQNKNKVGFFRQKIVLSLWLLLAYFNEPIEYFNFTFLIISFLILDGTSYTKSYSCV